VQAGKQAYQFYANEDALEYLSQACEILEDLAPELVGQERQENLNQQFELLSWQRNVCNMMGDREREFALLQQLQELAEITADREQQVEVMSRLATYYWHVGKLHEAEQTARKALEIAQEHGDERGEQYALERIARVLWTRRDPRSMEYATRALTLAQRLGDRARQGRLTNLIGNLYTDSLGDPERALNYFNQALEICRDTHNPYEEAWTLWGLGGLAMLVDDYTAALKHLSEARRIAEEIGATLQVGWDIYHSGDAWYNLGDFQQALENYQQALDIFGTAQHPRGKVRALVSIGLAHLALGRLDEARDYLEPARQRSEDRNDTGLMFRSYQALVSYYLAVGTEDSVGDAIRLSNRIINLAEEEGNLEQELLGYHLRAIGFFARSNLQEALSNSSRAVSVLERISHIESPKIASAQILFTHSRLAGAMGQLDTARQYLRKAHQDVLRQADLIEDDQLRSNFLNNILVNREIMAAVEG
jgi:tetratricopeptide (TPR) repeat protein